MATPPLRPAEYAEEQLIMRMLDGRFTAGTALPGERELAQQLGVTRPTIREVLQRLSRDGWIRIQHGRSTRVRDIWRDGGLNVLESLVRYAQYLPEDFVPNLLAVRLDLAPAYARAAVERNPGAVADFLSAAVALPSTPEDYAAFDWQLHRTLTIASGNPIYTMILNGFSGFYELMALHYFASAAARVASQDFYQALLDAARERAPALAEAVTLRVIAASLDFWAAVELHALP